MKARIPSTPWLKDCGFSFGDWRLSVCKAALNDFFNIPHNAKAIRLRVVPKPTAMASTVRIEICPCGCEAMTFNGYASDELGVLLRKHFPKTPKIIYVECEYR